MCLIVSLFLYIKKKKKPLVGFWCRWGLNSKFQILLIELIGTRDDKIGHDSRTDTTWHDMKLASYGLRLNEFVSYLGWHDWLV